jgi:hypothetical protein
MLSKLYKIIAVFVLVALAGLNVAEMRPAKATFQLPNVTICHNETNTISVSIFAVPDHLQHGDHLGACVVIEPEPSVTPTPSIEPSVSPTPQQENPCEPELEVVLLVLEDQEEVPCASPTPSPTETPSDVPHQDNWQLGGPNICQGVEFVRLPANVHVIRRGDEADVKWTPTQGGEVSIHFYENENVSNAHGLKTENDGFETIRFLGSKNWTFQVLQWEGCATSGRVTVVDGSESMLFRALPYQW